MQTRIACNGMLKGKCNRASTMVHETGRASATKSVLIRNKQMLHKTAQCDSEANFVPMGLLWRKRGLATQVFDPIGPKRMR